MDLIDFQKALGSIKATKITKCESYTFHLDNKSVLGVSFCNGEFRKFWVDGKNKQETLDLIELYMKNNKKSIAKK